MTRPGRRFGSWLVGLGAVLLIAAVVTVIVRSGASTDAAAPHAEPRADLSILVTDTACGPGWVAPSPGRHTFLVTNRSDEGQEVELEQIDAPEARIFGQIERLGPGTTRPVTATLGSGQFVWLCAGSAGDMTGSKVGTIRGGPPGDAFFVPVTAAELQRATATAQTRTRAGLMPLVADTDRLQQAADAGDEHAAKTLWLVAHIDYERLGDAYDSFGPYADEIDGRPQGLPAGVADPSWQGFLRLEYALWHDQRPTTVAAIADRLDQAVHQLQAAFPVEAPAPSDLAIRVHEILENSLQFQLTGQADQGSHTTLATARANVDGARAALRAVAPLLASRSPTVLATAVGDLDHLASLLDPDHRPDGTWTPLTALSRTQREQLDALVGQTVEDLATIPDLLEPDQDQD